MLWCNSINHAYAVLAIMYKIFIVFFSPNNTGITPKEGHDCFLIQTLQLTWTIHNTIHTTH
jgi:hypothetical protein